MKFLKKYRYTIISFLFVVLYGVILSTFEYFNRTVFDILCVLVCGLMIYFSYKDYIAGCKYVSLKLKIFGLFRYLWLMVFAIIAYEKNVGLWEGKVSNILALLVALSLVFSILAYGEKYKLEKENEVK
ncbi:MAG: hypothetical protein Q3988_06330 [Gemella sp.]|nr:hypothetical protein [Gemella sp.]